MRKLWLWCLLFGHKPGPYPVATWFEDGIGLFVCKRCGDLIAREHKMWLP